MPHPLEELAAQTDPPHRYTYPTTQNYEQAFSLWRALRRDTEPTRAERSARLIAMAAILGRLDVLEEWGEDTNLA